MLKRKPNIDPMELLESEVFTQPIIIPAPKEAAEKEILRMLEVAEHDILTFMNLYEFYEGSNIPDRLQSIIDDYLEDTMTDIKTAIDDYVSQFDNELPVEIQQGIVTLLIPSGRLALLIEADPEDVYICAEPDIGDVALESNLSEFDLPAGILPPGPTERALIEQLQEVRDEIDSFNRLYDGSGNMPDQVNNMIELYVESKLKVINSEVENMLYEFGIISDSLKEEIDIIVYPLTSLLRKIESDPEDNPFEDCGAEIEGYSSIYIDKDAEVSLDSLDNPPDSVVDIFVA